MDNSLAEWATIPAGPPLIAIATDCYRADVPLLLIGPHGIGKSELLQQAARELGIGYIDLDLSVMEPIDLVGIPREKDGLTSYCPPARLPREGRGILVFEELNRCASYMRAPTLQLLTARRVNDYLLPPGWLPMASVNPSESDAGYEVHELDPALLSRFVKVGVKADRMEWLIWARKVGIHEDVLRYVTADPKVFDSPKSNPRAWAYVSRFLSNWNGNGTGEPSAPCSRATLRTIVSGLVGDKRAAAFFKFLKSGERPLQAEEILGDYTSHRDQLLGWIEADRLDPVSASLHNLKIVFQAGPKFARVKEDAKAWSNLGLFMTDLPGDLREEAERFFRKYRYEFPASPTPRGKKRR
jgi:hypothetical protein